MRSPVPGTMWIRSRTRPELLKVWGTLGAVVLVGFAVAWWSVDPPPPDRLRMAAGRLDGAYHEFAETYRARLAEEGLELELVPSAGSVANLRLLESGEVSLAFVQGGTASGARGVEALASLYFEPLWVFYRKPDPNAAEIVHLSELEGWRLAVGSEDSGTRLLSLELLEDNGLYVKDVVLSPLGGREAAEALLAQDVDAAFFVTSPRVPYVRQLLETPGVELMSFRRSRAYRNRHRFLSTVTLGEGMIDLSANVPARDRVLIAPATALVARQDLHPALVPLLLAVATEVHRAGGLFEAPGQFPSPLYTELPLNASARHYLEDGPSFLFRILPFWIASLLDRTKILLLPLITLLFPLFKIAPPVYRWSIRSKIFRWYRVLREIDQRLDSSLEPQALQEEIDRLRRVQDEVATVSVPLSYMEEFYNLRMHIGLIIDKLERRKEGREAEGE